MRTTLLSFILGSLVLLAFTGGACAAAPVGSEKQGAKVAEEFVRSEATFRFDGIPNSLKLKSTTSVGGGWEYTFELENRHPGYGNRTGQVLAQVITPHVAVVTVQSGRVTSAEMDNEWDMLKGQRLPR